MRVGLSFWAAGMAAAVTAACLVASPAMAQKQGGTLRISHRENPPSASILEESTVSVNQPFMAIFNNLVVFETVNALCEAVAVARASGLDPKALLDTLSKGSADSFALRNHGLKAIVPGNFPERAFSTEYALKDLSYALELARDAGIKLRGAELIGEILQEAIDAGSGGAYFPVIARYIDGKA